MRRVVVTGIGAVSPLGGDIDTTWKRLINGESGISIIDRFDTSDLPCKIAGTVPHGDKPGEFNDELYMSKSDQRKTDRFVLYGLAAAQQAVEDAGWMPEDEESRERTGVMIGAGIGGLPRIYDTAVALHEGGFRKVSPFFIPASLINLVAGHVSIKYGFQGPNHATVTACSSGAHAIGDSARMIACGDCDVMVAGGAEAAMCKLGIAGFAAMRALSTHYNDTPEKASRPWDEGRDGFVMGEGSGIVVLEELEHAKKRGAKIYAEVVGYGLTGDANHMTAPHPEGKGAARSMRMALRKSGVDPSQVGYVNAHGTSTPMGDELELGAVRDVFGTNISVSSTKSAIGHLLGAAGGIETIFTIKALTDGILPPTLNLDNPSEPCRDMDLVPKVAKKKNLEYALSNSFGFGGTNASLLLKKWSE